jgi:putative membrane protein
MIPRLVFALAVNGVALWLANVLFDGVRIHGWAAYIIGAAVLGFANAVIKPVLTVLALPLIIITLGFAYLAINIAMVALAEWIAPNFSIDGFWTYVGIVVIVWGVNWIADQIVEPEKRRRRRSMRPSWTR